MTRPNPSRLLPLLAILLAGCLLLPGACTDAEIELPTGLPQEVSDYGALEVESTTVIDLAEVEANGTGNQTSPTNILGSCIRTRRRDSIDIGGGLFRRQVTITFGSNATTSTAVTCSDGRSRLGQIIISWTASDDSVLAPKTIRTLNYFVNGSRVRVNATINWNTADSPIRKTVISSDTIEFAGSGTTRWTTNRTWRWFAGGNTANERLLPADDQFAVQGTAQLYPQTGTAALPIVFGADSLIWQRRCASNVRGEFIKGTISIGDTVQINYGAGNAATCDRVATLLINGRSEPIRINN